MIKNEIINLTEIKFNELSEISDYIFNNPEIAYTEYKAQKKIVDYLETNGFKVKSGIGGLETSFEADFSIDGGRPVVAFLAEYDALPEIGHACGHNIIGTSALGAFVVLKEIMEKHKIKGTLKIIGTPAEERGGGKIQMIKEGVFQGIDAALLLHPTEASIPDDISFASANFEFIFKGKPSHAAAFPWEGVNALNGVIALFNNVNSLRLHLKDYTRVHGIIPEGGTAHNIIPERATALFNIRALEIDYLNIVIDKIKKCALGAAISTETTLEIRQVGEVYKEIRNDKNLVETIKRNFNFIEETYVERSMTQGIGSTDMANLTHEIPAIQAYIFLKENIATHTLDFATASGGEEGKIALKKAIKVLALSGFDILTK